MPAVGEQVNSKPLSGDELKKIMLRDLQAVMDRDCVISGVSAFGRVAYEVNYKLHFDNQSFREDSGSATSQEVPPLDGIPVSTETVTAQELHREIENPTQARVEFGLPVPVVTRNAQGRTEEKEIKYPANAGPPTKSVVTDKTDDTVAELAERKRKRGK